MAYDDRGRIETMPLKMHGAYENEGCLALATASW